MELFNSVMDKKMQTSRPGEGGGGPATCPCPGPRGTMIRPRYIYRYKDIYISNLYLIIAAFRSILALVEAQGQVAKHFSLPKDAVVDRHANTIVGLIL